MLLVAEKVRPNNVDQTHLALVGGKLVLLNILALPFSPLQTNLNLFKFNYKFKV